MSVVGVVLTAMLIGCGQSSIPVARQQVRQEKEQSPSWEEKILNIRGGGVQKLQHQSAPVPENQFEQLLQGCEELTVLEVDHSLATNNQLVQVLKGLPKLRQLRLEGPVDDNQLAAIVQSVPDVRVLNLPHGTFHNSALKSLASLDHLELLRFSSANVDDAGLMALNEFPKLKFLHLINVPVTDAGLKHVVAAEKLQSFYLDGSRCTEEGLSAMIESRPDLHFHWNQLHLDHDPHSHPHD